MKKANSTVNLDADGTLPVSASGTAATPQVRTNNPIVGTNDPNVNIDVLDAAIGADADLTAVTRSVGQVVANSTILAKIDALDSVIGFDAQVSTIPNVISKSSSIYQNLEALDAYKSIETKKFTIGGIGVENCDFNFVTAEDAVEQSIDLGAIIAPYGRIIDIFAVTTATFTGAVSLGVTAGIITGGNGLLTTADMITAGTINQAAMGGGPLVAISATEQHIFINGTPGANWSLATAGKLTVYITYNQVTNI